MGLVLTLMFLGLFAMASSIQVLRTEALYEDPRNVRASLETYKTQRPLSSEMSGAAEEEE